MLNETVPSSGQGQLPRCIWPFKEFSSLTRKYSFVVVLFFVFCFF